MTDAKKRVHFFASRLEFSRSARVTLVENERVETIVHRLARDFVAHLWAASRDGMPLLLPRRPTWQDFVSSFCPVRELDPGDRPRDWLESANDAGDTDDANGADNSDDVNDAGEPENAKGANDAGGANQDDLGDTNDAGSAHGSGRNLTAEVALPASETPHAPAPARAHLDVAGQALAPERYKVQFTATEESVRLVDEAKALLSRVAPAVALEELHLRAMRALVATLKKRKYATKEEPPNALPKPAPNPSFLLLLLRPLLQCLIHIHEPSRHLRELRVNEA